VDQPNARLEAKDEAAVWSLQAYKALGVPNEAFTNARFFAPAHPKNPNKSKSLRKLTTSRFEWDLSMIHQDVPSLFHPLDWDDKMEGAWYRIEESIDEGKLLTYTQMLDTLDKLIKDAEKSNNQWPRGVHIATWNKLRFHLQRFPRTYEGLLNTAGKGNDIPWKELKSGSAYVVDIQMLNDRGQRLVFGRAVRTISDLLETEELDLDAVVVFVDELNKFAPAGTIQTPLKSRLVEITARGRSVGMVLFGAEQFASSVEKEIVENSSTFLFGRTETNELRSPNYSAFSAEVKIKLTMLPQGQLLVKFAKFPQPIFVRFPFPPCLPGDQFTPTEPDKKEVQEEQMEGEVL
jgi:hypothetical protein